MINILSRISFRLISIVLISITLLISLWTVQVILFPFLFVVLLWIFHFRNNNSFTLDIIDFALIGLFIIEFFNCLTSSFQANTLLFFRDFSIIVFVTSLIKILLKETKYQLFIILFISSIALLLTIFNLSFFFYRYFETKYYGFSDFSQFRFLYNPLGFVSNEWVTIMLTFLPFLISCFLLLNKEGPIFRKSDFLKHPILKFLIGLAVLLIIFNLFISFSRGGYIAFIAFIFFLNILLLGYKVISPLKLFLGNVVFALVILIMIFSFFPTIKSTFNSTISHHRSTEGRINQWETSKKLIKEYPFFGIGSNNFALINQSYKKRLQDEAFTGRVNNSYIQILTEKGIIGTIVYLFLFLLFIFYSHRKITNSRSRTDKALYIVIFCSVLSIVIRELFFSSIFYNSWIFR